MYLPVPGFEPMSYVFLGECDTHWPTAKVLLCEEKFFLSALNPLNNTLKNVKQISGNQSK